MGIFDYRRPHVSKRAFRQQVRMNLRRKGLSRLEVNKVEQIFRGDIEEKGIQAGIDRDEVSKGIDWMRKNIASHKIPKRKIDIIEKELRRHIR